ncbi:hypothetical protein [Corallococcus sp. CA054B]|uniref:hypothetical protein n=1 Tax=Corallococcus sp. CA054B TaxID=2316734 RepID=UPI0011C45C1A|nr:hypothetical protein [Corallococcus sp. CA054B]
MRDAFLSLDTSALSRVLETDESVAFFAATARKRRAVILVSRIVLFEITAISRVEYSFEMIRRLQLLFQLLGRRACPSYDHMELMEAEVEGDVLTPLVYSRGWESFVAAGLPELHSEAVLSPFAHGWLQDKKSSLLERDLSLPRQLVLSGIEQRPDIVVQAIERADSIPHDYVLFCEVAKLSRGGLGVSAIAGNPTRFKATHLMANLEWRTMLANCIDRPNSTVEMAHDKSHEAILGTWRTKAGDRGKGTQYDLAVASAAAYSDFFVTNDGNQLRRCEFLREKGLVDFVSCTLSEFEMS